MGMGEPMANYKAVIGAVRQLVAPSPDGLGMSARGITVSTVGLVPRMQQLATEGIPVTLALSLHAPDDELRDELVPINTRWNIDEVVNAAWEYARQTKRRVSIEYILIRDVNDQAFRADLLAKVLKRRGNWGWVHVNLIPLNPTPGSRWTASRRRDEDEFVRRLRDKGVPVTVRDTRVGRSTAPAVSWRRRTRTRESRRLVSDGEVFAPARPDLYEVRSQADGPGGALPLTDDLLRHAPSGTVFGMTQNVGMGADPARSGDPGVLLLSTQGGLRRPDGSPAALGYHTGHYELGTIAATVAEELTGRGVPAVRRVRVRSVRRPVAGHHGDVRLAAVPQRRRHRDATADPLAAAPGRRGRHRHLRQGSAGDDDGAGRVAGRGRRCWCRAG